MCIRKKCNWCGIKKKNTFKITLWCKWYGLYMCESCYDNKILNIGKKYPTF